MKVPWVKRVLFGSPVQLRRTPVHVIFRYASDNTVAPQWNDLEGTKIIRGASKHVNGIIKAYVNPGRYHIDISDGSNFLRLENQVVFLDIDQFDAILSGDVDSENDSVLCYSEAQKKYVLISVLDFFAVQRSVEIPFKDGIVDGITQGIAAVKSNMQVESWGTVSRLPSPNINIARVCRTFGADLVLYTNGSMDYYGGPYTPPTPTEKINHVSGQLNHYFAVQVDGVLLSWGDDSYGQSTIPAAADNGNILKAVAANQHSIVLRKDGTVFGWGRDLGGLTPLPSGVLSMTDVIDCHMYHPIGYVLRANGDLVMWGSNISGYLTIATDIIEMSGGQGQCIALTSDGNVRTFGVDGDETTDGETGIPDGLNDTTIVSVHAIRPTGFIAVHPGGSATWWNIVSTLESGIPDYILED